jgi:hypothetical protein
MGSVEVGVGTDSLPAGFSDSLISRIAVSAGK